MRRGGPSGPASALVHGERKRRAFNARSAHCSSGKAPEGARQRQEAGEGSMQACCVLPREELLCWQGAVPCARCIPHISLQLSRALATRPCRCPAIQPLPSILGSRLQLAGASAPRCLPPACSGQRLVVHGDRGGRSPPPASLPPPPPVPPEAAGMFGPGSPTSNGRGAAAWPAAPHGLLFEDDRGFSKKGQACACASAAGGGRSWPRLLGSLA